MQRRVAAREQPMEEMVSLRKNEKGRHHTGPMFVLTRRRSKGVAQLFARLRQAGRGVGLNTTMSKTRLRAPIQPLPANR